MDYDYVLIPTNNNKLHWVIFIIVPAECSVECYDSLYDANGFHNESLSVIIKLLKDYQVSNKCPTSFLLMTGRGQFKKNLNQNKTMILIAASLFAYECAA
jgi:Ulp1 family protease